MGQKLKSPSPKRHGLDAARLKSPAERPWPTVRDHLVERLPMVAPQRIDQMFAEQRFRGPLGPLARDTPFEPDTFIWFHRDLPDEIPVPFEIQILHRDEDLLVTTASGGSWRLSPPSVARRRS